MRFFRFAASVGSLGMLVMAGVPARAGGSLGALGRFVLPRAEQQGGGEDTAAFRAARAVVDPTDRLQALQAFAEHYPESALRPRATELALSTALRRAPDSPGQTELVHRLAAQEIADAPAGLERWIEQARVADALAGAQPSDAGPAFAVPIGADLPDAQRWAHEAVTALTEDSLRRETAVAQRRYKLPPLTMREVHRDFLKNRVLFLSALAHVDLSQGNVAAAEPLLAEAFRLDPLASEANALRGELALARHQDAAALGALERAEVTGALPEPWHATLLRLYGQSGGEGGEEGLQRQLDGLYEKLFPLGFTLPPRSLGGRTVLLELFTGSGCEPCVAPDLAMESLLRTYRRRDLAVLEWDENIPRPDPLTSPAAESRAGLYRVGTTPEAFLDGKPLPVPGSSRAEVENVVVGFADEIEYEAAQPGPFHLALQVKAAAGSVGAQVAISPGDPAALAALGGGRPVLHVALVQDHIRYGGENGVRFHRMVVRALGPETVLPRRSAATAASSAAASSTTDQTVSASFDLKAIDTQLRAYLDGFERNNDRFGEVHFRTKDFPLDPGQLAVVAWVQDAATHEVLQAAFAAVGSQVGAGQ